MSGTCQNFIEMMSSKSPRWDLHERSKRNVLGGGEWVVGGGVVNGQVMGDLAVLVGYFDHLPGRHPIISTWSSSWHLVLFLSGGPLCPVWKADDSGTARNRLVRPSFRLPTRLSTLRSKWPLTSFALFCIFSLLARRSLSAYLIR